MKIMNQTYCATISKGETFATKQEAQSGMMEMIKELYSLDYVSYEIHTKRVERMDSTPTSGYRAFLLATGYKESYKK